MIADASGDEGLIDAILEADATGTNLFIVIGSEMYGEKITKADPRYSALKAFCYARAYGAGHETLADTAGVPVKQIQHIEELFDTRLHACTRRARRSPVPQRPIHPLQAR
jgi:hypothetical protein